MKKILLIAVLLVFAFTSTAHAQITKDQHYARLTLSGDELDFYDAVYSGIETMQEEIDVSNYGINKDDVNYLISLVYSESPELFYKNQYWEWDYNGENIITYVRIKYDYSQDEIEELNAELAIKADEIIGTIPENATEYEKFNVIGRYIVDNVVYGMSTEGQTIVDALINENAVCAGLCRSLQYLLYKVDIPCYCVISSYKEDILHMVNIIQIDGDWYWFDITAYTQYQFDKSTYKPTAKMLPLKDDTFKTTHTISEELNPPLPACTSDKYANPTPTIKPTPKPTVEPTIEPEPIKETPFTPFIILIAAVIAGIIITIKKVK